MSTLAPARRDERTMNERNGMHAQLYAASSTYRHLFARHGRNVSRETAAVIVNQLGFASGDEAVGMVCDFIQYEEIVLTRSGHVQLAELMLSLGY